MTQETRNKIYAVAASLVGLAVILGIVDANTQAEVLSLISQVLDLVSAAVALIGLIAAFIKSLPGRVTTVSIPKGMVDSITTTAGETVNAAKHLA